MGWDEATQPYIAFLDADDSWYPQKIEIQYKWMKDHPDVSLTGHGCRIAKEYYTKYIKKEHRNIAFKKITSSSLLLSNRFPTPTVMIKRSLPYRFYPGKRHCEDYLLWCQINLDGYLCYKSEHVLANLHKAAYGEGGLSSNLLSMEIGELEVYSQLFKENSISYITFKSLQFLSLCKYIKRLFIVAVKKHILSYLKQKK
jgi:glycosyltransferase involved in cell wall biosynthesis